MCLLSLHCTCSNKPNFVFIILFSIFLQFSYSQSFALLSSQSVTQSIDNENKKRQTKIYLFFVFSGYLAQANFRSNQRNSAKLTSPQLNFESLCLRFYYKIISDDNSISFQLKLLHSNGNR